MAEKIPLIGSGERGEMSSDETIKQALAEMKELQEQAAAGKEIDQERVRALHRLIEVARQEKTEIRKTP